MALPKNADCTANQSAPACTVVVAACAGKSLSRPRIGSTRLVPAYRTGQQQTLHSKLATNSSYSQHNSNVMQPDTVAVHVRRCRPTCVMLCLTGISHPGSHIACHYVWMQFCFTTDNNKEHLALQQQFHVVLMQSSGL